MQSKQHKCINLQKPFFEKSCTGDDNKDFFNQKNGKKKEKVNNKDS